MATPPDQSIPPLRKVGPLPPVQMAAWLTARVPAVCDFGGYVLQKLALSRAAAHMVDARRAQVNWVRARTLFGGAPEKYWFDRWGQALERSNMKGLNRFTTALDILGAGATGIANYAGSAKDTVAGRLYDGAAGGLVDYAMGSTTKWIGGSPALAAADSVVEIGMKGAGLGSLFTGVVQAAPVMATDPARFHRQSLEGQYGTHLRLASAYGDFAAGDSTGLAEFHEQSRRGDLGVVFQQASLAGDYWAENGIVGGVTNAWQGLFGQ